MFSRKLQNASFRVQCNTTKSCCMTLLLMN